MDYNILSVINCIESTKSCEIKGDNSAKYI